jgi:uncharacterized delta-60 repeat protein
MEHFYKTFAGAAFILLILYAEQAVAQNGTLDPFFGNGGKVVTRVGDSISVANAVVLQGDGKIVTAGYSFLSGKSAFTIARYNTDGALDSTYGNGGIAHTLIGDESKATTVALQPDRKIVAGGYYYDDSLSNQYFTVARYNTNGTIDSTFGNNGIATAYFPATIAQIRKLVVMPGGRIITAGYKNQGFQNTPVFAQFLSSGTLDTAFGNRGLMELNMTISSGSSLWVNDMVLTPAGKILATIEAQGFTPDFLTVRLWPNGRIDSTFGNNGKVETDLNNISGDLSTTIAQLPDSSFIVAGYALKNSYYPIAIVKYHANGTVDSTFGTNGRVLLEILNDAAMPTNVLLMPGGSFLVTGYSYASTRDFFISKFSAAGKIDSSFGNNGIASIDFLGYGDESYHSVMQPDGKIVLVGYADDFARYNIALARLDNKVLPLRLLSFTARRSGKSNLLQWRTAHEINVDRFEIQRSANGREYTVKGFVKAGAFNYSFKDENRGSGINYYRLRMIDRDGRFTLSAVRRVDNNIQFIASVYPNPANNHIQVKIETGKKRDLLIQILSLDGKVITTESFKSWGNTYIRSINISGLQSGSYFLKISSISEQHVLKFEKL